MAGDENSLQLTQTARRCHGVVKFSAMINTCSACKNQRSPKTEAGDVFEKMLKEHFPGANELMQTFLRQQSEICHNTQDPRSRRWDKEIIQV